MRAYKATSEFVGGIVPGFVIEAWRLGTEFIGEIGERLERRGSGQLHRRRFDALGKIGRLPKIFGERKLRMDLKLEGGDAAGEPWEGGAHATVVQVRSAACFWR